MAERNPHYEDADRFNVGGRPMTETECYSHLVEALNNASQAAKGLAHLRKQMRWLAVAGCLQEIRDKSKALMWAAKGIWVPGSKVN